MSYIAQSPPSPIAARSAPRAAHGLRLAAVAWAVAAVAPPAGAQQVRLVLNISTDPQNAGPTGPIDYDGRLYFSADRFPFGRELWRSDGTPAGTVMVKDIQSGLNSSNPSDFVEAGGILFFTANDGENGRELWRTNGSTDSTTIVRDLFPGGSMPLPNASFPSSLIELNGRVLFSARTPAFGRELHASDGTPSGTVLIKDIAPDGADSMVFGSLEIARIGSTVYFAANDGTTGLELWKTDGSEAGTVLVRDINPGPETSFRNNDAGFTEFQGALFFRAFTATHGKELWTSRGEAADTTMLRDIQSGALVGPAGPSRMTVVGDRLFLSYNDGGSIFGSELWITDGTTSGTQMVRDINPAEKFASPDQLTDGTEVAGAPTLFFVANDGVHGRELWRSDGTAGGTTMVKDINPGAGDADIGSLTAIGKLLFFGANDGARGNELWRSDGTPEGTFTIADLSPGEASSSPVDFTPSGPRIFFVAGSGPVGRELWSLRLDPPEIDVDLSPIDFGAHSVLAGPTAPREIVVTNSGTGDLTFTGAGAAISGPGAAAFAFVAPPDLTPIAPMESRTFQIVFVPATVGPRNATLGLTTDDDDESALTIALAGVATAPEVEVIVDPFIFFRREIDRGPSPPLSLFVRNLGQADLRFLAPGPAIVGPNAADFAIVNPPDPATPIPPDGQVEIQFTFDPATVGFKDAVLRIVTDDPADPEIEIALVGFGFVFSSARAWMDYR
jgi:ELWxxDGT repeat protein